MACVASRPLSRRQGHGEPGATSGRMGWTGTFLPGGQPGKSPQDLVSPHKGSADQVDHGIPGPVPTDGRQEHF